MIARGVVRKWFGEEAWIDSLQERDRVPVPDGVACAYCDDAIEPRDSGALVSAAEIDRGGAASGWHFEAIHAECLIRIVVGGIAHLQERCSCFGGPPDELPAGMSRHHEALLVVELLSRRPPKRSLN